MSDQPPPPPPPPPGPEPSKRGGNLKKIALVSVAALSVLALFAIGSDEENGEGDEVMEAVAFDVCKDFVKDRLKSPGSAQFPDYWDRDDEVRVTTSGDRYTVRSHVDSENSFGALLQTRFTCVVEDQGDDTMRLEDLTLHGR